MLMMVGASASGKTEIAKIMIEKYEFKKLVTYTTRPMRNGERDGIDYHFLDKEAFELKIKLEFFIETTVYNDHYYGTAFKDASFDKVLIVEPMGANTIYQELKDQVIIFYLEASKEVRGKRMKRRGDLPELIEARLIKDEEVFKPGALHHIDYRIQTEHHSLEELADHIYTLYSKSLV